MPITMNPKIAWCIDLQEIGLAHVGEPKLPDEIPPPPKPIEEPKANNYIRKKRGKWKNHTTKPHVLAAQAIYLPMHLYS